MQPLMIPNDVSSVVYGYKNVELFFIFILMRNSAETSARFSDLKVDIRDLSFPFSSTHMESSNCKVFYTQHRHCGRNNTCHRSRLFCRERMELLTEIFWMLVGTNSGITVTALATCIPFSTCVYFSMTSSIGVKPFKLT